MRVLTSLALGPELYILVSSSSFNIYIFHDFCSINYSVDQVLFSNVYRCFSSWINDTPAQECHNNFSIVCTSWIMLWTVMHSQYCSLIFFYLVAVKQYIHNFAPLRNETVFPPALVSQYCRVNGIFAIKSLYKFTSVLHVIFPTCTVHPILSGRS